MLWAVSFTEREKEEIMGARWEEGEGGGSSFHHGRIRKNKLPFSG